MNTKLSTHNLRYATAADLPHILEICLPSFRTHPFFVALFPSLRSNPEPEGWREFWWTEIVDIWNSRTAIFMVIEDDGKIVSLATWRVFIDGYTNLRGLELQREAVDVPEYYMKANTAFESSIASNRANQWHEHEDPVKQAADPIIPHWWVFLLATDLEHRHKGYATQLIKWGLKQAQYDGVVTGLYAARRTVAEEFYNHMGFKNTLNMNFTGADGGVYVHDP